MLASTTPPMRDNSSGQIRLPSTGIFGPKESLMIGTAKIALSLIISDKDKEESGMIGAVKGKRTSSARRRSPPALRRLVNPLTLNQAVR